jgi:tetratricopeptide (TPR) repeat protein/transcriptional regulator with XRE-family HTH domain
MTQQELARRSGLGVRTVRDLESGRAREPRPATRRLLAEALGLVGEERDRFCGAVVDTTPERPARTGVPAELPADVACFIGRDEELRVLADVSLSRGAVVAIVGRPGVGKTALAVHAGHQLRGRFEDGQLYANLQGYAPGPPVRPIDVLARFLRALGVPTAQVPVEVDEAAGVYRSLLVDRRMLVVLDNARDPDQVRPLLPAGASCFTLVTGRDTLAGLVARDSAVNLPLDSLTGDEARALLARRLGAHRVSAEPAAAEDLARLCGYLPLALCIASANLAGRPRHNIATYVDRLRTGNPVGHLAVEGDQHTAIAAAFDLSYLAQPEPQRRLFRLLSLAPGPDLPVEAAAALAGQPATGIGRLLERLASAHLVEEPSPGRYALHDLLRAYAASRAAQEEPEAERTAALGRLFAHYLYTADRAAHLLYPEKLRLPVPPLAPDPAVTRLDSSDAALAWLDAERPNLVATTRHAATAGHGAVAWLLADTMRGYFWLRMHAVDWQAVARAGLAAAEAAREPRAQAAAHLSLADRHMLRCEYPEAIDQYRLALTLNRRTGWAEGESAALGNLGNVYWRSGDLLAAADHYGQALDIDRRIGWLAGQAVKLGNLGSVYRALGRLPEAEEHYREALALDRQAGSLSGEAVDLSDLGDIYHAMGRTDDAFDHLKRALDLTRKAGDRASEAEALRLLAAVHRDRGECGDAMRCALAALSLATELGERRIQADAANTVGTIERRDGRPDRALAHHRQALRLADQAQTRYSLAEALLGQAAALHDLGCPAEATDHARRALGIARLAGYGLLVDRAQRLV